MKGGFVFLPIRLIKLITMIFFFLILKDFKRLAKTRAGIIRFDLR
ncbi:hypothetical protein CLV51_105333 [Chitinophaga niastensis]|uniref:Uncharacterized protein n=1 Tax=Chitinophaga niastensis TaxID=536980 RepID=A0A2P8HFF3_CHINA|nr:hypothetical protein CLV51_105333 [Chitinophaga niastensis]